MKIKIGIDGNEANQKIRVGSGVFALELLKHFNKFQIPNSKFQINPKFKIYLKNKPLEDLPSEGESFEYKIVAPSKLWTQIGLPITLWREKILKNAPNVYFSPNHYAPRFCPVPSVITIFDLSFFKYPEMFLKDDLYQLINWTKYSVKQAKMIITISENSKRDIINHYGIDEKRIVVAYPGYDKQKFKPQNDSKKLLEAYAFLKKLFGLRGKFILYVGTIQPRKNILNLVKAFSGLKKDSKNSNLQLIIAGKRGWLYEEIIDKINKYNFKKDIIIPNYISDDILVKLYQCASGFVLPSYYEGFGLPVIEAMACGCPVVVSDRSSLPEIVGEAGLTFDPDNIQDIMAKLELLISDETVRRHYMQTGLLHVKKYDFKNCAKKTLEVLLKLGSVRD